MSFNPAKLLCKYLSPGRMEELEAWIAKYPKDQKQSAVMAALRLVQEEHGYLREELMDAVADYLDMPAIAVYEVASFYTMYEHKPIGQNLINVCTNISCQLRGSAEVVSHIEKRLGIKLGETSQDGCFTLRSVECMAACANAPMMQINKAYYEDLTCDKIDKILEKHKALRGKHED